MGLKSLSENKQFSQHQLSPNRRIIQSTNHPINESTPLAKQGIKK
jgi:hypothetical protein